MRVAVIGVGGVGSAAARFLAEEGHQVIAFEQHAVGHEFGSSHGESRIFRLAYPDPRYTRMMREALPRWERLEAAAGEQLMVRCGGLLVGPPSHPEVAEVIETLERERARHEVLGAAAVAERFPAMRLDERAGEVAVWHEDAGFLRATRCVLANVQQARAAGADIREHCRVTGFQERGDEVIVTTEHAEHVVDRAVVTAGPWIAALLPGADLPLVVTKQQVLYLRIREGSDDFDPSRLPVWIDAVSHDYGFPSDGRIPGVKVASHLGGPVFDPATPTREVDLAAEAGLIERSLRRLPGLSGQVERALACLYTSTVDEHFIFGPLAGLRHVVMASACSGHGFKFTILSGETVARMAVGRM